MTPAAHAPGSPFADAIEAEASGGARHAALLLHAMAPVDRAWMLDALPLAQRDVLRRLLAELEALGIASDPGLIADATAGVPGDEAQVPRRAPMSDEEMLHALDHEQLGVLVRLMRAEPAGLVAAWLRVADWPWRQDLLAALDPRDRWRVEAALASAVAGRTAPALGAALIAVIATRLRERASAEVPAPRRLHPLGRSLRRLWPRTGSTRGSAP